MHVPLDFRCCTFIQWIIFNKYLEYWLLDEGKPLFLHFLWYFSQYLHDLMRNLNFLTTGQPGSRPRVSVLLYFIVWCELRRGITQILCSDVETNSLATCCDNTWELLPTNRIRRQQFSSVDATCFDPCNTRIVSTCAKAITQDSATVTCSCYGLRTRGNKFVA